MEAYSEYLFFAILKRVILAKNQHGSKVSRGYIIPGILFFNLKSCQNALSIFGNTFYHHTCMLNFVIFILDCEKSNAKFLSHTFQYSKVLKSSTNDAIFYFITSFRIRLICNVYTKVSRKIHSLGEFFHMHRQVKSGTKITIHLAQHET